MPLGRLSPMPSARLRRTDTLRAESACLQDLRRTQSPAAGNRSEFGEEFGEGSLEPLSAHGRSAKLSRAAKPYQERCLTITLSPHHTHYAGLMLTIFPPWR